MIHNIIEMLEIAKEQNLIGKYTHIALGKNKIPTGIVEAYKQQKREKWLKR
tara:strand:- start:2 stop:154 length:153 start_codon:yes stop_codon:yes gene_type:complete